jgi:hypothetical protein
LLPAEVRHDLKVACIQCFAEPRRIAPWQGRCES